MNLPGKLHWQRIDDNIHHASYRCPVPGGWLLKVLVATEPDPERGGKQRVTEHFLTFVPDAAHSWGRSPDTDHGKS